MDGLKRLVNTPEIYEAFNKMLDEKISSYQRTLEQSSDITNIYRLQGNIAALRRLKNLREEVNT